MTYKASCPSSYRGDQLVGGGRPWPALAVTLGVCGLCGGQRELSAQHCGLQAAASRPESRRARRRGSRAGAAACLRAILMAGLRTLQRVLTRRAGQKVWGRRRPRGQAASSAALLWRRHCRRSRASKAETCDGQLKSFGRSPRSSNNADTKQPESGCNRRRGKCRGVAAPEELREPESPRLVHTEAGASSPG
ncbi:hypothetical protein AOLI_G00314850 [Acnodon oligacanthus]